MSPPTPYPLSFSLNFKMKVSEKNSIDFGGRCSPEKGIHGR
jgi:hypothetical protein